MIVMQHRGHVARRGFESVGARLDLLQVGQRLDDANQAVPAHSQVADIVEENYPGDRLRIDWFLQQCPHEPIAAPWLVNQRRAQPIVFSFQDCSPPVHAAFAQFRGAPDHCSGRFACRVGVNIFDSLHFAPSKS